MPISTKLSLGKGGTNLLKWRVTSFPKRGIIGGGNPYCTSVYSWKCMIMRNRWKSSGGVKKPGRSLHLSVSSLKIWATCVPWCLIKRIQDDSLKIGKRRYFANGSDLIKSLTIKTFQENQWNRLKRGATARVSAYFATVY